MSTTIALFIIIFLIILKFFNLKEYARNTYYMMKLPGPHPIPIIGWTLKLAFIKIEDFFDFFSTYMDIFEHVGKTWVVGVPMVVLCDIVDCEALLGSMQYISKGVNYDSVKGWLNEGLLTSTGEKWHTRRKQLTSAFHFKILEESHRTMNKSAKLLTEKLKSQDGKIIKIDKFINLCTLDIICEAAMGVKLDAQNDKSSNYVSDIAEICEIIMRRNFYFWLKSDFTFFLTPTGFRYKTILKRLHGFTQKVITERKELHKKKEIVGKDNEKKRKAFLDCLIDLEKNNPGTFTEDDMREEVDTFMFEGHDTTSAAIVHALLFLGNHVEIQEKVYMEMYNIFEGSDREISFNDLNKMKYLEQVIKETLRLLPSVPIFSRKLEKDFITSKGYVVPRMTNVVIMPNYYHFKQPYFKDCKKFDPDRFSEENNDRPPYAYIPFSAGPRNCIGQKFAMMELKIILSTLIRSLKFKAMIHYDHLKFCPLLIVRSFEPIMMEFTPRN